MVGEIDPLPAAGDFEVEDIEVLGDPLGPGGLRDRGVALLQVLAQHDLRGRLAVLTADFKECGVLEGTLLPAAVGGDAADGRPRLGQMPCSACMAWSSFYEGGKGGEEQDAFECLTGRASFSHPGLAGTDGRPVPELNPAPVAGQRRRTIVSLVLTLPLRPWELWVYGNVGDWSWAGVSLIQGESGAPSRVACGLTFCVHHLAS